MILIIDNYDSFTYNLYQQIEGLGKKTEVYKNDEISLGKIEKLNPEQIIISPGPGRPENSGITPKVVQRFYTKIPILGVCLGMQCIGQIFGSSVIHSKKIFHGKTSKVFHNGEGIFKGIKNPIEVARYHSLIIDKVPKDFELTCKKKKGTIMGIRHEKYPLYGVQFHPESFLTEEGSKIMSNFFEQTGVQT